MSAATPAHRFLRAKAAPALGWAAAASLAALALTSCAPSAGPVLYAHRGGGEHAAKETLAAFKDAAAGGFALEFDVRKLKDGELVISHEAEAVDASGVTRPVEDFDSADWANACLMVATEQGVMKPQPCIEATTVSRVLESVPDDVQLAPELKGTNVTLDDLKSVLERFGAVKRSVVQSFELEGAVAAASTGLTSMYVLDAGVDHDFGYIASQKISYVAVSKAYPVSVVDEAKKHGLKVVPWTVDDAGAAKEWVGAGAAGVITNLPHTVGAALDAK